MAKMYVSWDECYPMLVMREPFDPDDEWVSEVPDHLVEKFNQANKMLAEVSNEIEIVTGVKRPR